jgi:hypothetical protein
MKNWNSPWGKTKKGLGRVHLPQELADDLWLWKQESPDSSPEAFIFSGCQGRIHGHRQLPPAAAAQIGEGPRTAEADLSK